MPQTKLDALPPRRHVLPISSKESPDFLLRLQLQKEVDRLAVLLDEVREQSAKVQAAADAIGDKLLSDQLKGTLSLPQQNDEHVPLKIDSRR